LLPLAHAELRLLGRLYTMQLMIAAHPYDMPAVIEVAQTALADIPPEASPCGGSCGIWAWLT
jgi:hypothetical protein